MIDRLSVQNRLILNFKKNTDRFIRYRQLLKKRDMTIIFGIKCYDGIVIASDTKVLRGTDWEYQAKIDGSLLTEVVVGASGTTAFFDKFKRHIKIQTEQIRAQKEDNSAPYENIEQFITVCERILREYKTEYGILETQNPIELLISINTGDGMPTLHHLNTSEQVAEEEIHRFLVIGHGEPYASMFMKKLWDIRMNMEQSAILACSIIKIIDDEHLDITVGGNPQIWFIPNKEQPAREIKGNEIQKLLNQRDEFLNSFDQKMTELKSLLGF